MANTTISEEQVKKALQIDSFRNLSKDKVMEFVSLIPNMDKDVAMAIINQFPEYVASAKSIVHELNVMCERILMDNTESRKDAVDAYKQVLDSLEEILKKDTISPEERALITKQMIEVADKIAMKDTEEKNFLAGLFKYGSYVIIGTLLLGATILGVNVKGNKIPSIKS